MPSVCGNTVDPSLGSLTLRRLFHLSADISSVRERYYSTTSSPVCFSDKDGLIWYCKKVDMYWLFWLWDVILVKRGITPHNQNRRFANCVLVVQCQVEIIWKHFSVSQVRLNTCQRGRKENGKYSLCNCTFSFRSLWQVLHLTTKREAAQCRIKIILKTLFCFDCEM